LAGAGQPAGCRSCYGSAGRGEREGSRCRFELVLRRVRAGRPRMPVGAGGFVWSRVYAGDVARAVLAALGTGRGAGQCLNIVEEQAAPMRLFCEQVIAAADARLELIRVPDKALPPDLVSTGTISQHLLASPAKARAVLGWHAAADPRVLRRAVAWHLRHPPGDADADFSADDAALAAAWPLRRLAIAPPDHCVPLTIAGQVSLMIAMRDHRTTIRVG